ncbi:LGFP repeat-containing protein [Kineococcus arenarius]|uniref:LGFP repeat-containing protein n=1 Tax=unclassified Kineococcus TaxID=2621656 RepID=UPI003D7ED835
MKNTVRTAVTATLAAATVAALAVAVPAQADPRVGGQIGARYEALGGAAGFLGEPITGETGTPDGRGSYVHFQGGSVYWSPTTGAHEVHGAIRATWAEYRWEAGSFGFPVSDEYDIPGGKRTDFQGGSMQWTATGGVTVIGDSDVAGCPAPFDAATPEQAAGCLARGWEQRSGEVMATYAVNAVVGELLATPHAPMTFDGCSRPATAITATSAGIECVHHIPQNSGAAAPHGVDLHLGIGIHDGAAVVEDVEFVG